MIQPLSGLSPFLTTAYLIMSAIALVMCSVSIVAVSRTLKTPRSVKLLSIGLLLSDILFLVTASISNSFDFHDIFIARHLARGFQVSAQIIITAMSLDRWFVLGFPYTYLRYATDEVINKMCIGVIVGSFLQYIAYRVLACYAFNMVMSCPSYVVYYGVGVVLLAAMSIFSQVKVFIIIQSKTSDKRFSPSLRQYKGTLISLLCLINQMISLAVNMLLVVIFYFVNVNTTGGNGHLAEIANYCNLMNCIVDPLIYVIWLRETRLQILKMVQLIFPYFKKTIEDMRIDIFNIPTVMNYNEANLRSFQEKNIRTSSMNQAEEKVNVNSTPSYLDIRGEKTHSVQFDQIVQNENRRSFKQVVHEVNIHKTPLNQVEQVEKIYIAPLNHVVQEINIDRDKFNQKAQVRNVHSTSLCNVIQEENSHIVCQL